MEIIIPTNGRFLSDSPSPNWLFASQTRRWAWFFIHERIYAIPSLLMDLWSSYIWTSHSSVHHHWLFFISSFRLLSFLSTPLPSFSVQPSTFLIQLSLSLYALIVFYDRESDATCVCTFSRICTNWSRFLSRPKLCWPWEKRLLPGQSTNWTLFEAPFEQWNDIIDGLRWDLCCSKDTFNTVLACCQNHDSSIFWGVETLRVSHCFPISSTTSTLISSVYFWMTISFLLQFMLKHFDQ